MVAITTPTKTRSLYLELAQAGRPLPIGADLVLHDQCDPEAILRDGRRLGQVVTEAAWRYQTPLALPVMDLMVEKAFLLQAMDVPAAEVSQHHFHQCPDEATIARTEDRLARSLSQRLAVNVNAVAFVAQKTDLLPVGMSIGPFSLLTKLVSDPITPVYLAGSGVTADDDAEVKMIERLLALSTEVVIRSVEAQIKAGAKAIFIAEPAANKVYFSPIQLEQGSDVFERYVMRANRRVAQVTVKAGVDLLFHCCGELTDDMVRQFGTLHPAILSLGSSRKLWEDARLLPKDVVLYGNLPSKQFFSDDLISRQQVQQQAQALLERMAAVHHPFILGTECDVLSVPGAQEKIKGKVHAMLTCHCM